MCFKDSVVSKILGFVEKCKKNREANFVHYPCTFCYAEKFLGL